MERSIGEIKPSRLIEKHFLIENPNAKIVTPVSSSTLIKDIAEVYAGEIVWTKVGSVTVSQTMKEVKASWAEKKMVEFSTVLINQCVTEP
jgi:phosphomannomutase